VQAPAVSPPLGHAGPTRSQRADRHMHDWRRKSEGVPSSAVVGHAAEQVHAAGFATAAPRRRRPALAGMGMDTGVASGALHHDTETAGRRAVLHVSDTRPVAPVAYHAVATPPTTTTASQPGRCDGAVGLDSSMPWHSPVRCRRPPTTHTTTATTAGAAAATPSRAATSTHRRSSTTDNGPLLQPLPSHAAASGGARVASDGGTSGASHWGSSITGDTSWGAAADVLTHSEALAPPPPRLPFAGLPSKVGRLVQSNEKAQRLREWREAFKTQRQFFASALIKAEVHVEVCGGMLLSA